MTDPSTLPVSNNAESGTQWFGTSKILGPQFLRMPILTIGMLGLQMVWSVEMSYASPYLLSLGMSKSLMSIVFLAGPLSGLVVQPLIGALSDGSHSRFGRRRPYIFLGTCISFGAMYVLGFTREFASVVTKIGSTANNALTIGLAVSSIYCIDFSINAVQAMDRALLVDILPVSEQERGNAWAGRMFGLGSVLGFFAGNVDLTSSLAFLGHTQLEILCVTTSCILLLTHLVTIFSLRERTFLKPTDGTHVRFSLWRVIKIIWRNFFTLPGAIKRICLIQLFAWIGWFPVLFWTSLYVGELHKRNSPVPITDAAKDALNSEATRFGTRAMLCNALASLLASFVCPFFVTNAHSNRSGRRQRNGEHGNGWIGRLKSYWKRRPRCHLAMMWTVSHGSFSACMLSTFLISNVLAATVVITLTGFSWAITQWAPFALIAEAIHDTSFDAPSQYVLGNVEDGSDDEGGSIPLRDAPINRASEEMAPEDGEESRRLILEATGGQDEDSDDGDGAAHLKRVHFDIQESESHAIKDAGPSPALPETNHAQQSQVYVDSGGNGSRYLHVNETTADDGADMVMSVINEDEKNIEDKAGIILGIHNIFIVIPQFIISGLSSIIFAIMDTEKPIIPSGPTQTATVRNILLPRAHGEAGAGSADSVGIVFRIGGVSAAIACVLCLQLARQLKRNQ